MRGVGGTRGTSGFDEFVQARTPALLRTAVLMVGDRALAQRILIAELVRVRHGWGRTGHGLDREPPETAVLAGLARAAVAGRARRTVGAVRPLPAADQLAAGPDESPAEHQQRLLDAWDGCSAGQRVAVVLVLFADRSRTEVAGLLGRDVRAVSASVAPALADPAAWQEAFAARVRTVDTPADWCAWLAAAAGASIRRHRRTVGLASVVVLLAIGLGALGVRGLTAGPGRTAGSGAVAGGLPASLPPPLVATGPVERAPISMNTLPVGPAPRVPYVIGADRDLTSTVVLPDGVRWRPRGQVVGLSRAGADGVVALVSPVFPASVESSLVFRAGNGRTVVLATGVIDSFVVSPDGTRVAWAMQSDEGDPYYLVLASLPGGQVRARPHHPPSPTPTDGQPPNVIGFIGSDVVLDYARDDHTDPDPYRWSVGSGRIGLLFGAQSAHTVGRLRELAVGTDTALVFAPGSAPAQDCLHALSISTPAAPDRWSECGAQTADVHASPDGRRLVSVDSGFRIMVQDTLTGRVLARLVSQDRRYVWLSFDTWESDGSFLVDLSQVGSETQMRCTIALSRCERVGQPAGPRIDAVAAAAGTPVELP